LNTRNLRLGRLALTISTVSFCKMIVGDEMMVFLNSVSTLTIACRAIARVLPVPDGAETYFRLKALELEQIRVDFTHNLYA